MPHFEEPMAANTQDSTRLSETLEQKLNLTDTKGPAMADVPIQNAVPAPRGAANRKKKRRAAMKPGASAARITRGFQTPATSGGEESDFSAASTPRLGPKKDISPSATNSPELGPSALTRAISFHRLAENLESEEDGAAKASGSHCSAEDNEPATTPLKSSMSIFSEDPETPNEASNESGVPSRRPIFANVLEGGLRTDSPHRSPHRKMTANDFEPLKCLGKGSFGTVLLVKQHSTGRLFAQKQLKKATVSETERLIAQTKSERKILESVKSHPFVVTMYYAFQDHQKLYLILEYAQGGELFRHLQLERTFSEEVAAFYMAEMVLALDHLHRNLGVVYRDLKPENCLLDAEGHLLLTDFGLSKMTSAEGEAEDRCNSILGTIDYMAPEVVAGKPYDAAVDWWSLGAVGYDLLTGAPPFMANNHAKTQQKILHSKPAMPYYLGPDSKDFLTRLLRKEPRKRLGGNMPKDMVTIKSHRFFRRVDWKALEQRALEAPIQPIVTDPAAAENFADEFTGLAMSPVDVPPLHIMTDGLAQPAQPDELFSGFSYVASNSLLDSCPLDI